MRVWIVSSVALVLGGCSDFVSANAMGAADASSGGENPVTDGTGPAGTDEESSGSGDETATSGTTSSVDPTSDSTTDSGSTFGEGSTTDGGSSGEGGESSTPVEGCGDGRPHGDELCDDGNADELDGCTSACIPGPTGVEFGATLDTDLLGGGSTTGIQNSTENCPPTEVLVGLGGGISIEGWLGVIGGQCRAVELTNADPPLLVTHGPPTELPEHGGYESGGPWQTQCPDDQAIVAVRGGAGDVMDGLQIQCADVQTVGDPGAYTLDLVAGAWEPLQGGSGGSGFGPLTCPAGTVATGLQTETNSYVIRLRLLCREIGLAYP